MRSHIRPADNGLDEMRGVTACRESISGDRDEIGGGPGGLLGSFEDDGITGGEGRDDGAEEVVELLPEGSDFE